jgi:hypothetical protein
MERSIIFSSEMVRAILKNRKTQTRRVIKPQPEIRYVAGFGIGRCGHPDEWCGFAAGQDASWNEWSIKANASCPYGQPGTKLWVKETWCPVDDTEFDGEEWVDYKATPRYAEPGVSHPAGWENLPDDLDTLHWKPSIHMPRWASRLTLEIINVRVERVQDISQEDIESEGLWYFSEAYRDEICKWRDCASAIQNTRRKYFKILWDSINLKRGFGWDSNPFVWVIEFKRIENEN